MNCIHESLKCIKNVCALNWTKAHQHKIYPNKNTIVYRLYRKNLNTNEMWAKITLKFWTIDAKRSTKPRLWWYLLDCACCVMWSENDKKSTQTNKTSINNWVNSTYRIWYSFIQRYYMTKNSYTITHRKKNKRSVCTRNAYIVLKLNETIVQWNEKRDPKIVGGNLWRIRLEKIRLFNLYL